MQSHNGDDVCVIVVRSSVLPSNNGDGVCVICIRSRAIMVMTY